MIVRAAPRASRAAFVASSTNRIPYGHRSDLVRQQRATTLQGNAMTNARRRYFSLLESNAMALAAVPLHDGDPAERLTNARQAEV